MKAKFSTTCFMISTLLVPVMGYAAEMDRNHTPPSSLIKDSAITAKIKAKLAAEHFASTIEISVDTNHVGAVVLSGTASTQAEVDKAVAISSGVDGVTSVKSEIVIKADK